MLSQLVAFPRALFLSAAIFASALVSNAAIVVDHSPDTTGATLAGDWLNEVATQVVGGKFTLTDDAVFSGASIFGTTEFSPPLGGGVKVLIYSNNTDLPFIGFDAVIDATDSLYTTTEPSLTRRHVTFDDEFELSAGTYWFAMPSISAGVGSQASGYFGDETLYAAFGGSLIIDNEFSGNGSPFFQLEGTAVPEPTTVGLMVVGGCAVLFRSRKRR